MKKSSVKNFKIKISLLFLAAFIIPIITFVVLNYFDTLNYEDLITGGISEDRAKNQKEVFEYWIRNKESAMESFSEDIEYHIKIKGINESIIDVSSHGENNPLVRTTDEVEEPKNRRVEIVIR